MTTFAVGDVVVSTDPGYPLRSGASWYPCAVVVQVEPLVLVSEEADMRWQSTVQPEKLRKDSTASPEVLARCMARL